MNNKTKILVALATSAIVLSGCSLIGKNIKTSDGSETTTISSNAKDSKAEISQEDKKLLESYKNKIYPGVSISGVDVSNLTKEEAIEKINTELMPKVLKKKVLYTVHGVEDYSRYDKIKVALDPKTVDEAIATFESSSDADKVKQIKEATAKKIDAKFTFNKDYYNFIWSELDISVPKGKKNFLKMEGDKLVLNPEAKTYTYDKEAFKADFEKSITADLGEVKPFEVKVKEGGNPISNEQLAKMSQVMSKSVTNFSYSIPERKYNIKLAASRLTNTVVMPGEEFSLHNTIGNTEYEDGYKESMAYIGDKMVPEAGGGVCQVSTNIYNAMIYAGINPTERHNHGMVVHYVPTGMDAAIYFPDLDLKFKNTLKTPIFIEAYADDDDLTVKFYGDKAAMDGYTYDYRQEIISETPATTKEVDDPTLPLGESKTEKYAFDGYEVRVYKQWYKDGKMEKEEEYYTDTYEKVDGLIKNGTKRN